MLSVVGREQDSAGYRVERCGCRARGGRQIRQQARACNRPIGTPELPVTGCIRRSEETPSADGNEAFRIGVGSAAGELLWADGNDAAPLARASPAAPARPKK